MNLRRWHPELIGLILVAFLTRFWLIHHPNAVVFDEVYFKAFAAHYLDGRYYFDIHPPLGKLLLAGVGKLWHIPAGEMLSGTALPLRYLPAAAGSLIIPLVWGTLRRLGATRAFAFLGAFVLLLDNALLVESRFILMDSLLLLFGIGAFYLYLVARTKTSWRYWLWLTLAALSAGAAVSIKWTGLTALALVGGYWAWDQRQNVRNLKPFLGKAALLVLVPLCLYTSVFWAHFALLPKSGDGDAFMSVRFQSTLQGSAQYNPAVKMGFVQKFIELNTEMYQANQTLTATHPYGSHWYSWPLEVRPIYYWQGDTLQDGRQGNIYLLGNPVVWWGVWVALIAAIAYIGSVRHKLTAKTRTALALTGGAYLMNFLPFIAVTRVMFLYHYFFSFLFSVMFVVLLWNDLAQPHGKDQLNSQVSRRMYAAVLIAVVTGFLFFSPLTYGLPLSPSQLQLHMWLRSWR